MPSRLDLPAAVLTDMDGLLLDTETLSLEVFHEVSARHGFSDDGTIFPQLIGLNKVGHQAVFARCLPSGIDPVAFDTEWKQEFLARLDAGIPLKPGARAMLAWLGDQRVPVALVTSTARAKAETMMQRTGLIDHFEAITGGDDVEHGKPAPDIYLHAAARLGVDPGLCLAFEDSANGVRAAHAAGTRVIQVVDLQPPDDALRALGHPVVASLADLADHLGWGFAGTS